MWLAEPGESWCGQEVKAGNNKPIGVPIFDEPDALDLLVLKDFVDIALNDSVGQVANVGRVRRLGRQRPAAASRATVISAKHRGKKC